MYENAEHTLNILPTRFKVFKGIINLRDNKFHAAACIRASYNTFEMWYVFSGQAISRVFSFSFPVFNKIGDAAGFSQLQLLKEPEMYRQLKGPLPPGTQLHFSPAVNNLSSKFWTL